MGIGSALVDLRNQDIWDPSILLASSFQWPVDWPLVRLDEIGEHIQPVTLVEQGTQVITPDGIDRVHGGVRRRTSKYQGSGYLVGGRVSNLQPHDLAIPSRADIPAFLVSSELTGSTVSAGFSVYRFADEDDARWVWAVLSSTSGRSFRSAYALDSRSTRRGRLSEALIPWPQRDHRARKANTLTSIERNTLRQEEEAVSTWWSTVDLRHLEWRIALATPQPERLLDGIPLQELSHEIKSGKTYNRDHAATAPGDGLLPVVTGTVLAGRHVGRWLSAKPDTTIAEPGDVLVAAVGERANARIAEQPAVIDNGVYRIRLLEPAHAHALVSFLNGQNGYALRGLRLSGTMIPRLNKRDLLQTRVPESALTADGVGGPIMPLAEELEQVLWIT